MASSPSDLTSQDAAAAMKRRQRKGPNFMLLLPLIYAPVLPLIRIGLRHQPVLRDRLFTAVLVGAFAHGTYLVVCVNLLLIIGNCLSCLPLVVLMSMWNLGLIFMMLRANDLATSLLRFSDQHPSTSP